MNPLHMSIQAMMNMHEAAAMIEWQLPDSKRNIKRISKGNPIPSPLLEFSIVSRITRQLIVFTFDYDEVIISVCNLFLNANE